jgi:hypothetical protein
VRELRRLADERFDRPPHHVSRAETIGRRFGAMMSLVGVVGVAGLIGTGEFRRPQGLLMLICVSGLLVTGGMTFALAKGLGRRRHLWAAQGLLAIGGTILLVCILDVAAICAKVEIARGLVCPIMVGFVGAAPLTWHAALAIRELKVRSTTPPPGFQPVLPRSPESQHLDENEVAHRSDSSL